MISVNEISNDLKDKLKKGSIATTATVGTLAGAKKLGKMGKEDLSNSLVSDMVSGFLPIGKIKGGVGIMRGLLQRKVGTASGNMLTNSGPAQFIKNRTASGNMLTNSDPVQFIKNRTSSDYNPRHIARGIKVAYQKLTDQY